MRNKYKKHDKMIEFNKHTSIFEKNINYSSSLNLKKTKSPTNKNSIMDKSKPILNRFNRLNQRKEKEKEKEKEIENNLAKDDNHYNFDKIYKDVPIIKINQTNEKEKESKLSKNLHKFTRYNFNMNSFITNDKNNLNATEKEKEREYINDNKNNEKVSTQNNNIKKGDKTISLERNANVNNNKINNINYSKLISYNANTKNNNKYNKTNENNNNNKNSDNNNNNKINEDINKDKKNENIINKNENNSDILNMKSASIKRKYNFSKLIDKIKQNKYLIQANKNKNKIITKDNNNYETNTNKNNCNNDNTNENHIDNNNIVNKEKININSPKKNDTKMRTESALINTENNNNNEDNNNKDNISETSSFISNRFINLNLKPKQSFQFLVHQASKNRDLSNSFHKYYESNKLVTRTPSQTTSEKDDYSINTNTEEQSVDKHKFRNLSLLKSYKYNEGDSISSLNTNINENKYSSLTDRKIENKYNNYDINNIKVLNFNYKKSQNENDSNYDNNNEIINKSSVITNNIINNNVYNTTLNFYKISNISNKTKSNYGPKSKALSSKNLMESDDIIYEDESNMNNINTNVNNHLITNNTQNLIKDNLIHTDYHNNHNKDYINFSLISQPSQSSASSGYLLLTNLELIFTLEKKFQLLIDKINKYQICDKECLDYILFFFNNKLYDEETKIFKNKHNKKNFLYNIKIEILCFFLCYDISFSKNFNQAAILLKTIFNLIHSNFLIFISYIINQFVFCINNNIDENNYKIMNSLQTIIKQELKIHLLKQDMNEYSILQIITNNSKNINNYYKMLIDNLYGQYYISDDTTIKFPNCLNNQNIIFSQKKIPNIISCFFFDAYRLLTNYDFNDLYEFFNIFLNKKSDINNITNNNKNINIEVKDNNFNNYNSCNISQNNNISKDKIIKYLLPKIKRYYKYSLVLDLDETLICIKRDNNNNIKLNKNNLIALIFRPGLLDFLHKMKQLYELILFSSGTSEYVSPIVKSIEKKEKFFEHILYRQHVTYDDNGNLFKNLNLLNRNVKNILIVDDTFKNFKYHKLNGICIKPFYGDVYSDKDTLKVLGSILYKIRFDADITGDIRISLNKEKNSISYSQIANNI